MAKETSPSKEKNSPSLLSGTQSAIFSGGWAPSFPLSPDKPFRTHYSKCSLQRSVLLERLETSTGRISAFVDLHLRVTGRER